MSIQEHLNKIRNAVYGYEVRESIAKGIETAYDDASEKDNANMEVKLARGTNPNLNARLNKMDATDSQNTKKIDSNHQEVTAQLQQKADLAYVDNKISTIKDGSVKGVYATLAALQAAYPTGNTNLYVVTADGKWYYWNNSVWTAGGVYQGIGIPEKSVGLNETKYLMVEGVPSKNLFDGEVELGGYKYADGSKLDVTNRYRNKNLIKVDLGSQITIQTFRDSKVHLGIFLEYDINRNVIRDDFINATKKTIQLRPNTAYINLMSPVQDDTYTLPSLTEFANMIVVTQGTGVDEYISPYPKASTESILDGAVTKEKLGNNAVTLDKLDNAFINKVTPVYEMGNIHFDGTDVEDANDRRIRSDFFECSPQTQITISDGVQIDVYYYNTKNTSDKIGDSSGWKTGTYNVPFHGYARIVAVYTADYTIDPNHVPVFDSIASLSSKIKIAKFKIYLPKTENERMTTGVTHAELLLTGTSVKPVAHRGYSGVAPENTLPAYEKAIEAGFGFCECDVLQTSDGEWVVLHDGTVDRTTDGIGSVSQMTLSEIKSLTVNSGPNIEQYPNLKIPKLRELLPVCKKGNLVPIIELKSVSNLDSLIDIIREHGMEGRVIIMSHDIDTCNTIRLLSKITPIQFLIANAKFAADPNYIYESINYIAELGNHAGILIDYSILTENIIITAHKKNVYVGVATVNDQTMADNLINQGVDMILTDSLVWW